MLSELQRDIDSQYMIYVYAMPTEKHLLNPDFLMIEIQEQYSEAEWEFVLCTKFGIPKVEVLEAIVACS